MKIQPKTYRQLCNTRDIAPNGEVQTYYANPDGTRGARKEEDKEKPIRPYTAKELNAIGRL